VIEGSSLDRLTVGNVVLVSNQEGVRIHRLVEKNGAHWSTRGDAMPQNDPPLNGAEILGRVLQVERGKRILTLAGNVRQSSRVLAWLLRHSRACRGIALLAHSACSNRGLNASFPDAVERKDFRATL